VVVHASALLLEEELEDFLHSTAVAHLKELGFFRAPAEVGQPEVEPFDDPADYSDPDLMIGTLLIGYCRATAVR
jgi:hypothetical protein